MVGPDKQDVDLPNRAVGERGGSQKGSEGEVSGDRTMDYGEVGRTLAQV